MAVLLITCQVIDHKMFLYTWATFTYRQSVTMNGATIARVVPSVLCTKLNKKCLVVEFKTKLTFIFNYLCTF